MSAAQLSRDVALRVGLAARVLPDIEPARLMKVLVQLVGVPLTEEKLARLTARQLVTGGEGELSTVPLPVLKQALDFLWGKRAVTIDEQLPGVEPPFAQEGSVRVAVASNGGERLDGHFGSCSRFLVYQVSGEQIRLVGVRMPDGAAADRNGARAELIADCDLLYVISIGGPAAAKVVRADIHPVKFPEPCPARTPLEELQRVLTGTPPPWLARAMGAGSR